MDARTRDVATPDDMPLLPAGLDGAVSLVA
jgi:hypothetical protein